MTVIAPEGVPRPPPCFWRGTAAEEDEGGNSVKEGTSATSSSSVWYSYTVKKQWINLHTSSDRFVPRSPIAGSMDRDEFWEHPHNYFHWCLHMLTNIRRSAPCNRRYMIGSLYRWFERLLWTQSPQTKPRCRARLQWRKWNSTPQVRELLHLVVLILNRNLGLGHYQGWCVWCHRMARRTPRWSQDIAEERRKGRNG